MMNDYKKIKEKDPIQGLREAYDLIATAPARTEEYDSKLVTYVRNHTSDPRINRIWKSANEDSTKLYDNIGIFLEGLKKENRFENKTDIYKPEKKEGKVNLIPFEDPFKIRAAYIAIEKLKEIKNLDAISLELSFELQPIFDKAFKKRKSVSKKTGRGMVKVKDVGFLSFVVNYGLLNNIPSYASDNPKLSTDNERAKYTFSKLEKISKEHENVAHICSEKYVQLLK